MSAVAAAVAVARAHGLRVEEPVVLRDRLNVLVHLRPAPVVARVAGSIAAVRPGDEWLRRELAVAGQLAAAGAPVVAPSAELPPGPHRHDGRTLSFWSYVPERDEPADPAAAGAALRDVHEGLRGFRGALPVLGHLTEAEALLARLAAEEAIDPATADALHVRVLELASLLQRLRAPVQPLHGDAHLGNVLNGPAGPLWNDWEDTCLGPVHWDAACLLAPGRVTGRGDAEAEVALRAAGIEVDPAELSLWIDARVLQGAIWGAYTAREHGRDNRAWLEVAQRRGGG
jgi:aminoglycoside phosphotransferase (APT) family kinase protein